MTVFRCPRCGATTATPLPALEAVCNRTSHHPNRRSITMVPAKEDDE